MSSYLSRDELDALLRHEDENGQSRGEETADKEITRRQKIELLLDIPVKARVVLGGAVKKLDEILTFSPGTVVETEKPVGEPVELHINEHAVAVGDVIVVGENYGLKLKQIIDPVERMKKLKQQGG